MIWMSEPFASCYVAVTEGSAVATTMACWPINYGAHDFWLAGLSVLLLVAALIAKQGSLRFGWLTDRPTDDFVVPDELLGERPA